MPRVFVPAQLRPLCSGVSQVDVAGGTVREVVQNLDRQFPGVAARLCQGDALAPGLAVSVGGTLSSRGLATKVPADAEVHFLPAIGGG